MSIVCWCLDAISWVPLTQLSWISCIPTPMTHFDFAAAASHCHYQKTAYAVVSWALVAPQDTLLISRGTWGGYPTSRVSWIPWPTLTFPQLHRNDVTQDCICIWLMGIVCSPNCHEAMYRVQNHYYYWHEPNVPCIPCIQNPVTHFDVAKASPHDVTHNCTRKCMLSIVCSPGHQETIFQVTWTRWPTTHVSLNPWPALMLPKLPPVPCSPTPVTQNCSHSCMLSIECSPGCQEAIFHVPGIQYLKSCDLLWFCWSSHVSHVFWNPWPKNCICRCMSSIVCSPGCQEAIFHVPGTQYPKTRIPNPVTHFDVAQSLAASPV